MEAKRFRGDSEIDRSFDAVYQSLIGNGEESGNGISSKRKCSTRFSQLSQCLSLCRSRISTKITQEKITLTLSDNSYIMEGTLPEAENITFEDCKTIPKQRMKTRYVHEKLSQSADDTIFQHDFANESNLDSGFHDILDTSDRRKEQNSSRYMQANNTCNTSVTTFPEDYGKQQLLCKACQNLHNKVRRNKSAGVKVFKIFDPNHWCSDYWMLNRIPYKDSIHRLRRTRNLKKTLKTLIAHRPSNLKITEQASLKCIRPHSFLQRNLRLCKRTHHRYCNSKRQKKSKSTLRPEVESDKNGVEHKGKAKKPYVLALSSSQEEDDYSSHKVKLHKGNRKQKQVKRSNTTSSLAGECSSEVTLTRKNMFWFEASSQKNIDETMSLDVDESGVESDYSFHIEPLPSRAGVRENNTSALSLGRNRRCFRDMLAELNSGHLCSTIVKEDCDTPTQKV